MEHRRLVLEELFIVVHHGRVGDLDVAERMPVPVRKWWIERTVKEKKESREQ